MPDPEEKNVRKNICLLVMENLKMIVFYQKTRKTLYNILFTMQYQQVKI